MIVADRFLPISVVIPCFRCAATVRRAVQSIEQQTQRPAEVILVDDASGDDTLFVLQDLLKQHPSWIKTVFMEVNLGPASARNAGWSIATHPYVAFLDADDSWHAEKLQIQFEYMENNFEVALCGHQCVAYNKNTVARRLPEAWSATSVSSISLVFRNAFSTPTVMVKRDIPFRFATNKRHAEDFLLWQQIAFSGLRIIRLEIPLAYVYKPFYGAGGLSSALWKMERAELDNLSIHYRFGAIGACLYLAGAVFSIFKYLIRAVRVAPARIRRRWQGMWIG